MREYSPGDMRAALSALAILLLGACGRAEPISSTSRARECADPVPGMRATIVLEDDGASPSCQKVRAFQGLRLVNSSGVEQRFTLGRFAGTVSPGESTTLDRLFGSYLDVGVHRVHLRGYDVEIWLVRPE